MNGEGVPGAVPGAGGMTAREAERIGVTVSCVVALLLASSFLAAVSLELPLVAFGSPLHVRISRELLLGVMAGIVSWTGAQSLYVLHPDYQRGTRVYTHCILPAMTSASAVVFWQRQSEISLEGRLIIASGIGVLLSLVLLGQYRAMSGEAASVVRLRTVLSVLSLAAAFYLWVVLYSTRVRGLVAVPGAFLVAAGLATDLLQYEGASERRTLWAVLVISLLVAECAWALSFGRLSAVQAGFVLLIVSYFTIGLTRRLFQGALTWQAVAEHAAMVLLLFLVMQRFGM